MVKTDQYALLGWPVGHSASPILQQAAFQSVGISAVYELMAVPPENLPEAIQRLKNEGYKGWNVTVPHKETVLPLLDALDPIAKKIGSVNTVLPKQGMLWGYSTDGYGFEKALERNFHLPLAGSRILFLGTGGATRAAAVYAALRGAAEITLVNRTTRRAEALAACIHHVAADCQIHVLPLSELDAVADAMRQTQVLIHGTSLGLHPDDPLPFPVSRIPQELPVFDMIYGKTRFQQQLHEQGNPVVPGWDMLIYQGCRSFEIWTGLSAPEQAMRQALVDNGKI
ncbi:MAG: shikimate dehydrogenase [Lentisphaeria bacterium]